MHNGSENNIISTIVNLSLELLDSISKKDWVAYKSLVDEKNIAIEPDYLNNILEGTDVQKFLFDLPTNQDLKIKENILNPNVRLINDISIICFKRLRQIYNIADKSVRSECYTGTIIWKRIQDVGWKVIHYQFS